MLPHSYVWKSAIATYDLTWYSYGHYITAEIEINLGIVSQADVGRPYLD